FVEQRVGLCSICDSFYLSIAFCMQVESVIYTAMKIFHICTIALSSLENNGIWKRSHTISTLPLRQKPPGQHTINLPNRANNPSSSSVIGAFVSGAKYIKI